MKSGILILFVLLIPANCWAGEFLTTSGLLLQMLWALLIVVGLILVIYALAKKQFGLGKLQSGAIKILEIRYLMPKTALVLVEVRGKELLVGMSTGKVELVADLTGQKADEPKKDFKKILAEKQ